MMFSEGQQSAREPRDRIGMLTCSTSSMTVYKNNVLRGVMVAERLSGPLCWAATLGHRAVK